MTGFLNGGDIMPYSKAHYFLVGILALTVIAFWPSYFGNLKQASFAHHFHGITASLWILLMAWQSKLAHSTNIKLHKASGKILFILIPLMVGAFALVTLAGAQKAVAGHPFYQMFGQALLTVDLFLILAVPFGVYLSLKLKKKPQLHSAYMFGTVAGLLPPILSRLLVNIIPAWKITGPETLHHFAYALHFSFIFTIFMGIAFLIIYKPYNRPWAFATAVSVIVYALYLTLGQSQAWASFTSWLAEVSSIFIFIVGFLTGLTACVFGWKQNTK